MYMYITFINKAGEVETRYSKPTKKNKKAIEGMLPSIYYLYEEAEKILAKGDIFKRYKTVYIQKKTGGKRRIDNPDEELKQYMREVVDIFTNKLNFIFPSSTFAYVKGRSIKQMAELHKNSLSVMKFDIKDFFPNCHLKFIMNSMKKVYPFCMIDEDVIKTIVKVCMLKYDGKYRLPQGGPASPILSNIAMIPIDYIMQIYSDKYTRYSRFADDIYVSYTKRTNIYTFKGKNRDLNRVLKEFNSDFKLNNNKTKYVRIHKTCGVWITGLMINRNHEVTIGHKRKQKMKAMIFSFLADSKNKKYWSKKEVYKMLGKVGYYKYIEPEYVDMIICKYEDKTNMSYHEEIKNILCH